MFSRRRPSNVPDIDVNLQNLYGTTALREASGEGKTEIVIYNISEREQNLSGDL